VVVDVNPENADITNPRRESFGLLLVRPGLQRARRHRRACRDLLDRAQRHRRRQARHAPQRPRHRPQAPAVGFDLWPEGRPIYGSDAYVEYGQADDLALEAREADDERWARIGG
jgi:hypothetical protein